MTKKEWNRINIDKCRAYRRKSYHKHKNDKGFMDKLHKWGQEHPEQLLRIKQDWAIAHPIERKRSVLKNYLKRLYNLSIDEYNSLLGYQENKCAICGKLFIDTPCVDHNHTTHQLRGLLCNPCNRALGLFNDDIEILNKAIIYLKG